MLRGSFDQALMPLPSVVKGVQACRLPAVRPLPSVVKGVQACRLPALKPLKPWNAPRQLRPHTHATALCLPAVRPLPSVVKSVQACRLPALKPLKTPKMLRSSFDQALMPLPILLLRAFKPAVCQPSGHCPLLLRAFKPAVCQPSNP